MTLIQIKNGNAFGNPVLENNFRMLFTSLSFPAVLTPEIVEPRGFGIYEFTNLPSNFGKYEKVVKAPAQRDDNGIWKQQWSIVDMTSEEKAAVDAEQEIFIRSNRNSLLIESDWTQVADAPVDQTAWATYRQQLRDISFQAGFPWEVQWPTQP
jgi:hypothetical protein